MGLFRPARQRERPEDAQRREEARQAGREAFESVARQLFGMLVSLGFPESSAAELAFAGRLLGPVPGGEPLIPDDASALRAVVGAYTDAINACIDVAATFAAGMPQRHVWLERVDEGYSETRRYFVVEWLNALIRAGGSEADAVEALRELEQTFTDQDRHRPSRMMWIDANGFVTSTWLMGTPAILSTTRPRDG